METQLHLRSCRVVIFSFLILLGFGRGYGQCPTAPVANPASYLITASTNANFDVIAGQVLVIQSGTTYTGNINTVDHQS